MIRVVIADDQHLIRAGFTALLANEPDIDVVGSAATGTEVVEVVTRLRPDVVLMDIRMPDGDGLWATEQIVADPALAATHIVIVTTFELDEYVGRAIRAGASGFLVKDTEPVELIRAVRVVAAGDALLSPSVTRRLLERVAGTLVDGRTSAERDGTWGDGTGPDGTGRDGTGRDGTGPDGTARDRTTRDRTARDGAPRSAAGGHHATSNLSLLGTLTDREREVLTLVGAGLTNTEIAGRLFLSPLTVKTHVSRTMTKLAARDRAQLVVVAYEAGLVRAGQA
ncbi:response regulator [Subtercola sp. YIM 133946]|uniref:response regulator n=1 Tax=Subtercola sp. YIM 133946 TaxID=3118909 RepID=UPI003FCE806B